jgi:hypothetical protein
VIQWSEVDELWCHSNGQFLLDVVQYSITALRSLV